MKKFIPLIIAITFLLLASSSQSQEAVQNAEINEVVAEAMIKAENETDINFDDAIFDDKQLLDGYAKRYENLSKEILLEIIKDESLSAYKAAAAIRVFTRNYSSQIFSVEKKIAEKTLLRKLNHADSPFTQVETMHALVSIDRYRYFKTMVPALIQKLDHYNDTVKEIAYTSLMNIISTGSNRSREAGIVFNTMRQILFLQRNRLVKVKEPDENLKRKLQILRWSVKILGTEELQRLPKEVIQLL